MPNRAFVTIGCSVTSWRTAPSYHVKHGSSQCVRDARSVANLATRFRTQSPRVSHRHRVEPPQEVAHAFCPLNAAPNLSKLRPRQRLPSRRCGRVAIEPIEQPFGFTDREAGVTRELNQTE